MGTIETKVSLNMAKEMVLNNIISAAIGSYTCAYAPDKTVVTISNLVKLTGLTKYGVRKAIKELIKDGMIYYTSPGCPAVVSCGEVPELVCDARPPINGYALTDYAYKSAVWHDAYDAWCESMKEWANGGWEDKTE